MTTLRAFKSQAALLISLADLSGHWPVMRASEALADVADAACDAALAHLFRAPVVIADVRHRVDDDLAVSRFPQDGANSKSKPSHFGLPFVFVRIGGACGLLRSNRGATHS